ncbi:MAG: phosphate signaling complex protein PhoU [Nitrospinota bacterium]|nr:phosphate signaling complex protein PhoU [Nitrospinota bacterium]
MTQHFQRELDHLKRELLELSVLVDDCVVKSINSLRNRDEALAREVIDNDDAVDNAEVALEEQCLKILALHQPVAGDLRFIIAALKINNELERVADLAVNIAERTLVIGRQKIIDAPFDFTHMANKSRSMLNRSIDSLITQDTKLAHEVCQADDEVDELNRDVYRRVYQLIKEQPENVEILINYVSVSRHLERMADYATNIAEDVIYLVEGKIIRHQPDDS